MNMASDYERSLLGAILLDNEQYFRAGVSEKHFGDQRARHIYKAIGETISEGDGADIVTVTAKLPNLAADIAQLTSSAISGTKIDFYVKQIRKAHKARVLNDIALEIKDAMSNNEDPDSVLTMVEESLEDATRETAEDRIYHGGQDVLPGLISKIEERYHSEAEIPGISTGFVALDSKILGWQKRNFYVIGARPSQGKSALVQNLAVNAAERGHSVGFISVESGKEEVMRRILAIHSSVDSKKMATGFLKPADFLDMEKSVKELFDLPIWIYDKPNAHLINVKNRARRMVQQHKCEIIFIDYLQIIRHGNDRLSQVERVREVSLGLKELARELHVPIVATAQLNRDADNGRPQLSQFQWASQVEQDADVAMLQHLMIPEDGQRGPIVPLDLYVEKGRDVGVGRVRLEFQGNIYRFREQQPDENVA